MSAIDGRYLASAALSAAAALLFLALTAAFLVCAGWIGLLVLAAAFGAFFAWFYLGPRPDLAPKTAPDARAGGRP